MSAAARPLVRPQPRDAPLIWRWKDIELHAERAVGEVAIDDVERRALILVNPAFAGDTVTTSNGIKMNIIDMQKGMRPPGTPGAAPGH